MSEMKTLKFPGDTEPREIVDAKAREDISSLSEEIANLPSNGNAEKILSQIVEPVYSSDTEETHNYINSYQMTGYSFDSGGSAASGKYMSYTDNPNYCCYAFNAEPNTNYKIYVSGIHNRFRICANLATDDIETLIESHAIMEFDSILWYETSYDSTNPLEFTVNSGECKTIYVYLCTGTPFTGTVLVEDVDNVSITDGEVVGYKPTEFFLFDKDVKQIEAGAFKWLDFNPWIVGPQEEELINWKSYDYNAFIENVYEPLREEFPSYISRSVIGRDASGTYDIYQYTFCPDMPEQTFYIQAGCHGSEPDGWIGLANALRAICRSWSEHPGLSYLRGACRIICVPAVNPYGVTTKQRYNSNGKDLNRDTLDLTQSESIAITEFISSINEQYGLSFALDCHTTETADWGGDCAIGIWEGAKNENIVKRLGLFLARKNAPERLSSYVSNHNLGKDEIYLPYFGQSSNTGTYVQYFNKILNLPGATIEYSDYVYDTNQGTSITIRKATELYANQMIQHALAKFGILF